MNENIQKNNNFSCAFDDISLINLEKRFVGFMYSLFFSCSHFKARKCHFSLPSDTLSKTICLLLAKLNFEIYSGLTSLISLSKGTYKIFKAMSSLLFSNLL